MFKELNHLSDGTVQEQIELNNERYEDQSKNKVGKDELARFHKPPCERNGEHDRQDQGQPKDQPYGVLLIIHASEAFCKGLPWPVPGPLQHW